MSKAEAAFQKANSLFVDEDFPGALAAYNEAIQADGTIAEYFIKRSTCQSKLKNFTDAVADANIAIKLAPSNPQAYMKKGTAAFAMDEYESAKAAFEKGHSLDPNNAQFKTWIRKCEAEIESEGGAAPAAETKKPKADSTAPNGSASHAPAPAAPAPAAVTPAATSATPVSTPVIPTAASAATTPAAPAKPKVRHEWFQSPTFVEIGVFAKNVTKEKLQLDATENSLGIHIKLSDADTWSMDLELCDTIKPQEVTVNYLPMKIEIKLPKKNLVKWTALERPHDPTQAIRVTKWDDASEVNKHQYPTSGKKKVDWDALAKEAQDEKLEGDAALHKVFQDIFSNGDEDQRRAMMKSFQESGGTVLSTNWKEVGKSPVKGSAPPGQEMKKWDDD